MPGAGGEEPARTDARGAFASRADQHLALLTAEPGSEAYRALRRLVAPAEPDAGPAGTA